MTQFDTYLSPFTWRYASEEMRRTWSETHKRQCWRQVWFALAETQAQYGVVQVDELADLRAKVSAVDVARALAIEAEIHHDLMAELMVYAEQCPVGGRVLHLGATSMDIEDNAQALLIREALGQILRRLESLLLLFAEQIETWAETQVIGFTHLQPAEPTTLGYRLAQYAQDLQIDWTALERLAAGIRGKGFKGAVGTGASFGELFGAERLPEFEAAVMGRLRLPYFTVTTQTYPRKQEYQLLSALAGLGGTLYKFAFDLRLLQSPPLGELSEPFGREQVGSSAMPFKRNPIQAEKIDSLARALAQMPRLAWDNAANSLLERTLDDSANRRSLLAEAFLISDELLIVSNRILAGLRVDEHAIARNLAAYGPFAAEERLLMALVKAGADRQEMHEVLRSHALKAWQAIQRGDENPLVDSLCRDERVLGYLSVNEAQGLMSTRGYTGDAARRARDLAREIKGRITADTGDSVR
jgi:adenylosuccinate lyase